MATTSCKRRFVNENSLYAPVTRRVKSVQPAGCGGWFTRYDSPLRGAGSPSEIGRGGRHTLRPSQVLTGEWSGGLASH